MLRRSRGCQWQRPHHSCSCFVCPCPSAGEKLERLRCAQSPGDPLALTRALLLFTIQLQLRAMSDPALRCIHCQVPKSSLSHVTSHERNCPKQPGYGTAAQHQAWAANAPLLVRAAAEAEAAAAAAAAHAARAVEPNASMEEEGLGVGEGGHWGLLDDDEAGPAHALLDSGESDDEQQAHDR